MKIVCAWCGKFQGIKAPVADRDETTTICRRCLRKELESVRGRSRTRTAPDMTHPSHSDVTRS